MHTPGHAVVNLALLGASAPPELAVPILLGATIPDVPVMVLYLSERLLHHTSEARIWSECYRRPFWQNTIHALHSIPGSLLALCGSLLFGQTWLAAFFGSALLHAMIDLPIHAEDAHRHFLPFSSYRFISPLSYWDPRHHGRLVALIEVVLVAASSFVLVLNRPEPWVALLLLAVVGGYLLHYYRAFVGRAVHSSPDHSG